jgi:hypothetical protein
LSDGTLSEEEELELEDEDEELEDRERCFLLLFEDRLVFLDFFFFFLECSLGGR